jgi:hypothetical protein
MCLQEVDWFHDKSSGSVVDCFHTLCERLRMCGVWYGHHAYGDRDQGGLWGCAVLSRFPLQHAQGLTLHHLSDYPRSALGVICVPPQVPVSVVCGLMCESSAALGKEGHPPTTLTRGICIMTVMCLMHAHERSGTTRVCLLGPFRGVLRLRCPAGPIGVDRAALADKTRVGVIAGDLNTLGHGWLRCSPYHVTDGHRWAAGPEAVRLEARLKQVWMFACASVCGCVCWRVCVWKVGCGVDDCECIEHSSTLPTSNRVSVPEGLHTMRRTQQQTTRHALHGWTDPFNKSTDVTMHLPLGIAAKLDWFASLTFVESLYIPRGTGVGSL